MDYMDPDFRSPKKAFNLNHSFTHQNDFVGPGECIKWGQMLVTKLSGNSVIDSHTPSHN